jgi:hypothetical protein
MSACCTDGICTARQLMILCEAGLSEMRDCITASPSLRARIVRMAGSELLPG